MDWHRHRTWIERSSKGDVAAILALHELVARHFRCERMQSKLRLDTGKHKAAYVNFR